MAGNSQRRGAIRKGGKKGPTVGSGGLRRHGLERAPLVVIREARRRARPRQRVGHEVAGKIQVLIGGQDVVQLPLRAQR